MKKFLEIKDLTVGFSENARLINDFSAEVSHGELIGLVGKNGAGKTTFLKSALGLISTLGGEVTLNEKSMSSISARTMARNVSAVFTSRTAPGNLDVFTAVSLGRQPYTNWLDRLSDEDKGKVTSAMERTGIQHMAEKRLDQLSDGERQKVAISRALAQDTPLVIMDEPTAFLDFTSRAEILLLLRQLVEETGKTILFSSHELDLSLQIATRIWLVDHHSKKLIDNTPDKLSQSGNLERIFGSEKVNYDPEKKRFFLRGES
ncbi:ABC transporter ATP-binding protein [Halocola ammonii]